MYIELIGNILVIVFLSYIGFGAYIKMKNQDKKYNIYKS